ncbi:MAG: bifunctional 3-deoxy-7-phosphoheptulonate synthase/chorismate mutase [Bacteroidetes bacterium]|nr:bifunctional 3-deoxy-7-phosphoheptulonate synthase/chorismate mutase [Bacteroidota bacterium]
MLEKYRKYIDKIDNDIANLLNKRKELTQQIMDYKLNNLLPINNINRENEIINQLINNFHNLNPSLIKKIFNAIFNDSKSENVLKESFQTINEYLTIRPLIIAGPCTVESKLQINNIANDIAQIGIKFLRGGCFKPRTCANSFQGLEDEGVHFLYDAARKNKMYTVSEILDLQQYIRNEEYIDIIQIGSRNMTSYGLLKSIGKATAKTNKYVLLKRGMSATINEFIAAADYILQAGNPNVILCLRGIRTFEQIDSTFRFTPDLSGILELKEKTKLPILFDPSHSTGSNKYVKSISKAALELGADGLMLEVHNSPQDAIVDSNQAIHPTELKEIV